MMLAARAGQSLTRAASRKLAQTRSIHTPGGRLLPHTTPTNLVHRARTVISRFISHIQGPSLFRPIYSPPSIRQSLSLPARVALSKPLRAPYLPRAPRIPGGVTQVGLGTARNFSTGRPIFQHIVENVPVAGRAFYELDWDVKKREERNAKVRRPRKSTHNVKSAGKLQLRQERPPCAIEHVKTHDEFSHYFSTPPMPLTTTYLQIPLAPTPTARVPLSAGPSPHLLPLSALAKEHASYSKHSIKVAALFRRLDAARVWEKGASFQAFGDPSGLCTILMIKFEGWTDEMVKGILGDSGKGWCQIQEIREQPLAESLASAQTFSPETATHDSNGENISFVMPELDFSIPSWSAPPRSSTPLSYMSFRETDPIFSIPSTPRSVWDDDRMSDVSSLGSYEATDVWSSVPSSPHSQGWLGFSSDFSSKVASNGDNPFV